MLSGRNRSMDQCGHLASIERGVGVVDAVALDVAKAKITLPTWCSLVAG
jgi:hypothetical protein